MKKRWEQIEIAKAVTLHQEGLPFAEIAIRLLRTEKAVKVKLSKLGCKQNKSDYYELVICNTCGNSFKSLKCENRKYCSQSCAAATNNTLYIKRQKIIQTKKSKRNRYRKDKSNVCLNCGVPVYGKFCSRKCQQMYMFTNETIPRFMKGLINHRPTLSAILKKLRGERCELCGLTEWRGQPLSFIVDHKNGDSTNNLPDNLQLICPNCDSQSPHFAGRNKGNGRKSRGIKRYELSQDKFTQP